MGVPCTSTFRFFIHTFLFVTNDSTSLGSTSSSSSASSSSSFSPDSPQAVGDQGYSGVAAPPDGLESGWLLLGEAHGARRNGTGGNASRGKGELQEVLECVQMYVLPIFIIVGVAGSSLSTIVLLGTYLRYKFLSHFLVCLNVSSGAFLLTVFTYWLADNGINVFGVPGVCQVQVFSSYFFTFLVVWVGVLGAYLVLWDWVRPRGTPWLNSPTAAKTGVLGLAVLGFTVYSYKTWTYFSLSTRGSVVCTVIPENEPAMEILSALDVLVLLVLPSCLSALFVIIVFVRRLCRPPHCCCCCLSTAYPPGPGSERLPPCLWSSSGGSSSSSFSCACSCRRGPPLRCPCGCEGDCTLLAATTNSSRGLGCGKFFCGKGRDGVVYTRPSGPVDVVAEANGTISIVLAAHDAVVGGGGGSGCGGGGGFGSGNTGFGGGAVVKCRREASARFGEVHRLVLGQCLCFLLLVAPRAVSTLVVIIHRWVYQQRQGTEDILLQHVFQLTFYLYFTVLPFCPAFTSSKFRLHCWSLLRRSKASRRPVVAMVQAEESLP